MLRKLLVITALFVTSSCAPLASPPSPLGAPAKGSSPISTPRSPILPTSSRVQTLEPTTSVQRAIEDLAARLNIDAGEITVGESTFIEITIPDTGCAPDQDPQPSIPAQVIGREITLRAQNQKYIYHAHGAKVMLCTAQTE